MLERLALIRNIFFLNESLISFQTIIWLVFKQMNECLRIYQTFAKKCWTNTGAEHYNIV